MKTFALIQDPSHGWLRVPIVEFNKHPEIHAHVSEYSYQSDKFVFLEEDADMELFINARTAAGIVTKTLPYSNKSRQSKIRKYPAYVPSALALSPEEAAAKWGAALSLSRLDRTPIKTPKTPKTPVLVVETPETTSEVILESVA